MKKIFPKMYFSPMPHQTKKHFFTLRRT